MSGFPNRPKRTDLGPTYENERPVTNPKREIGFNIFNLDFWQLSGLGRVAPLAVLIADVSEPSPVITYQGLAFDPNNALGSISISYGQSFYDIQFAAEYPDENGELVTLDIKGGIAASLDPAVPALGTAHIITGNNVEVHFVRVLDAVPVDVTSFILVLW